MPVPGPKGSADLIADLVERQAGLQQRQRARLRACATSAARSCVKFILARFLIDARAKPQKAQE